jgi:hypothetical protein
VLPPVAAVLPAEKLNETLVKQGLLPCCRFSGPLSINMTFLAIFDHLSLRPSGLKGRSALRGANPFHRKQRRTMSCFVNTLLTIGYDCSTEKKRKIFTVFGRGRFALEKIKGLQTESLS